MPRTKNTPHKYTPHESVDLFLRVMRGTKSIENLSISIHNIGEAFEKATEQSITFTIEIIKDIPQLSEETGSSNLMEHSDL